MIGYDELYELLRKEKYGDALQQLPKNFVLDFSDYLNEIKSVKDSDSDMFNSGELKVKKQLENVISIFRELMLRRKKKILNLVFVATETGIMKKDFENMLEHEREVFERMIKSFEEGDKKLGKMLNGRKEQEEKFRLVLFNQEVEQFVNHKGEAIGPYAAGELVNLEADIGKILVDSGKAAFVDEN